ncbi:sensor histidine kinase [Fictibacillus barbaricus]|uniref:histidine kinase n=1 Tax=Fictibacillus barbaricus TaxID=182136 RepID=A0ABS2Z7S4_9BACL|nr:HAMP domain-containing sensor histidine kinase [Fictibacillus barbaricus]MBN3544117.1 HAMP domain-containing histidine kinase [Fictibacillus barbaricus]GGB69088.1 two-component sensor histidine kinase [Fictibacillus barbaricus]
MVYLTTLSFVLAFIFLIRLNLLRRGLINIKNQLREYNTQPTNQKISIGLFDKELEEVAVEINLLIESRLSERIDKEKSEHLLKQAIANMSHDLRTPLTSILGYIQLLEHDEQITDEKRRYLDITKKRTKRLQSLINEFFELSVIESVDYQLKLKKLNFTKLLWEILLSFFDQLEELNMVPEIDIPKEDIFIMADESAVRRVIENLINNVINHAIGKVSISLEAGNTSAILRVRNQASDLAIIEPHTLFDRFYTSDKTRSGEGTGLGLSIAKSLMLKMEGSITAEKVDEFLVIICEWKLSN